MDQGLKERLIGAAVLVALGVWLIPWLLDGRQEQVELETSRSTVRLPAPDGPLPVRTQTLNVDAARSEPIRERDASRRGRAGAPRRPPLRRPPSRRPTPPPAPATRERAGAEASRAAESRRRPAAAPRVATASPPAPASKPAPKPAASATLAGHAGATGDWAVQLGSFGDEENAKKLAQRVNVYGYKPEVATIRSSGRAMYRVRVGPYRLERRGGCDGVGVSAHGFSAQVVAAD